MKRSLAFATLAATSMLAACGTTGSRVATEPTSYKSLGNGAYSAYAESTYSVNDAQHKALRQAQVVCGKQYTDVMPNNETSSAKTFTGKMGFNLMFTCGKMTAPLDPSMKLGGKPVIRR